MNDNPQRPFIPHRTPKGSRQESARSEFVVSPPFVPSGREVLPPIDEFLAREHANVEAAFGPRAGDYEGNALAQEDELPPVEHFMDPLPPVIAFAPDSEGSLFGDRSFESTVEAAEPGAAPGEGGWIQDDWQHYDWRAAAALGESGETEASNEWASTDWEVSPPRASYRNPTAAEAIASALDEIARRIRDGEVSVPPPGTLNDPVAIAASLAALLGVKR